MLRALLRAESCRSISCPARWVPGSSRHVALSPAASRLGRFLAGRLSATLEALVGVASSRTVGPVLVLDLDPGLGAGIGRQDWEAARHACRGTVVRARRGMWEPPASGGERLDLVGLVIVEGMVCRELALRDRHLLEVLGPGDVVQLPAPGRRPRLGESIGLSTAAGTVFVVLGRSFIVAAGRWPCLLASVQRRLEDQRERLAVQGLIAHLPRAEHRVLLALAHLAGRWGRPTPEGTLLPLTLNHALLGQLTRARRPTVTLAVSQLESEGAIRRLDDGSWLLTASADRAIEAITTTGKAGHALGESFMLHQLTGETSAASAALRGEASQIRTHHARSAPEALERGDYSPQQPPGSAARDVAISARIQTERSTADGEPEFAERRAPEQDRTDRFNAATRRAASAARAARVARARAAEAHARAVAGHEESARMHDRAAELAANRGDVSEALRYRELAVRAREAERRTRIAVGVEAVS